MKFADIEPRSEHVLGFRGADLELADFVTKRLRGTAM
jgi:hypothetical protein